ncbi:MAG: hypothetical protein KGJ59_06225, partial [Bacteroidota bacterium]|nr:hypothetical protein [Bacteroidota bacterium]
NESPRRFWVVGKVIAEHSFSARAQLPQTFDIQTKKGLQRITFVQLPTASLPPSQRQQTGTFNKTIPALVEEDKNGIRFTVFLDTYEKQHAGSAEIEQTASGELVVTLQGRVIEYRLPENILE